jgi:hypothetical protein
LNVGPEIGTIVGSPGPMSARGVVEDAPAREVLGPDTEAGQALLVAGIGVVILFAAVGPEGGLVGRAGRVLGTIALVAAAMVVVGWAARNYSGLDTDRPLAKGLMFDL